MLRLTFIHILIVLLAVGMTAYAQSAQWGYQPTYNSSASPITVRLSNTTVSHVGGSGGASAGAGSYGSSFSPGNSKGVNVNYSFRTTSVYIPTSSSSKTYTPIADKEEETTANKRKNSPWDATPTGDPVGEKTQVPVGDPLVLLMMALLYGLYRMIRKRPLNA